MIRHAWRREYSDDSRDSNESDEQQAFLNRDCLPCYPSDESLETSSSTPSPMVQTLERYSGFPLAILPTNYSPVSRRAFDRQPYYTPWTPSFQFIGNGFPLGFHYDEDLELEPALASAAQPQTTNQELPPRSDNKKSKPKFERGKSGRTGPLKAENRKHADHTRKISACLRCKLHKIKCLSTDPSSVQPDDCIPCLKAARPCYRILKIECIVQGAFRVCNEVILKAFPQEAGRPKLSLPLSFMFQTVQHKAMIGCFPLELQATHSKNRGYVSGLEMVGEVNRDALLDIAHHLSISTGTLRPESYDVPESRVFMKLVNECKSWHMLLKVLPEARYSSSCQDDDHHAIKSFLGSMMRKGIESLHDTFKEAMNELLKIIKTDKQEDKIHCNRALHKNVAMGLAGLCRIANDIASQKEKLSDNVLSTIVAETLVNAGQLSHEMTKLGHTVYDAMKVKSDPKVFDEMVQASLPLESLIGINIVFDSSRTPNAAFLDRIYPDLQSNDGGLTLSTFERSVPVTNLFGIFSSRLLMNSQSEHLLSMPLNIRPFYPFEAESWSTKNHAPPTCDRVTAPRATNGDVGKTPSMGQKRQRSSSAAPKKARARRC